MTLCRRLRPWTNRQLLDFRLSQSRMQLQLDQKPTQRNLWAFSQCLLAEAETIALLQTSSTSTSSTVPLKLKQMDDDVKSPARPSPRDIKPMSSPTVERPCRYFTSDKGCKAGKNCKWQHDWDSLNDRSERCFICGSKEHRKNDCKLKPVMGKKPGEPGAGSGGGRGFGGSPASSSTSTATGGKAGAAAVKMAKSSTDGSSAAIATSTTAEAGATIVTPEVTSSTTNEKDGGRGGGNDSGNKGEKTAELLHEATQLLKSLRVQPKINVMQLAGLEQAENDWVLIDSGATHALRPAHDLHEWNNAERTVVQLANGETEAFRLKRGTKVLLGHPTQTTSRIVPMGGLTALDFIHIAVVWRSMSAA